MPVLRLIPLLATALVLVACASPQGAVDGPSVAAPPPDPRPCIELRQPLEADHRKFIIREPGHYCLKRDLGPRLDLYHRPAEMEMILIRADNVTLDLGGHTLGPTLGPRRSSGVALDFDVHGTPANIVIRNGVLSRLAVGVTASIRTPGFMSDYECPVRDHATNTLHFARSGITLHNITFLGNGVDFSVSGPSTIESGTPESRIWLKERRERGPLKCD